MPYRKKTKKAPKAFHFPQEEVSQQGSSGTMGLADDMRNLAQEIADSFEARLMRVNALKRETAAMLKGFQDDLGQKAAALKRFLSNAEASRMREFQTMHQGIRARQEERNGEVAGMLGGFRRELEAAAAAWRNSVAAMANKRASLAR